MSLILAGRLAVAAAASGQAREYCRHGSLSDDGSCLCRYPRIALPTEYGLECVITDCGHGNYSVERGYCICERDWRVAGPTNPFEYARGRFTQFRCTSNQQCVDNLGLDFAACPVAGWNCYCGYDYSAFGNDQAQCMYRWYAIGMKAAYLALYLLLRMWIIFLTIAVALLPVGKNVIGVAETYSSRLLGHDLAWSIFSLKLSVWCYLIVVANYFLVRAIWCSALLMLAVVFICLICCTAMCAMLCIPANDNITENPPPFRADRTDASVCEEYGDCTRACEQFFCWGSGYNVEATTNPAVLYTYDPWPYYEPHFYGYTWGPRDCECNCLDCWADFYRCSAFCKQMWGCLQWAPCFRHLVSLMPRIPENMLGGVVGWVVGTHALKHDYNPESPLVQALTCPCWSWANRSERWRQVVYLWLHERDALEAVQEVGQSVAEASSSGLSRVYYGDILLEIEDGSFEECDRILNMDDYFRNRCWICQDAAPQWDLWVSCRHLFCERCSGEMLRRRMPCPFCRIRSSRIMRRPCVGTDSLELVDHESEWMLQSSPGIHGM